MAELEPSNLQRSSPLHHCTACDVQQKPPGDCWSCGQPLEEGSLKPDHWFWANQGASFEHGEPMGAGNLGL